MENSWNYCCDHELLYVISLSVKFRKFLAKFPNQNPLYNVLINDFCQFSLTDSWEKNWVYSKHEGKEFGAFVRTAGKFFNDEEQDKGKRRFS